MIYINKSNVTRQLAALEESGFVIRRPSETDRRVTLVYPTQKAMDVLPRILEVLREWNNYITEDFTDEEKEVLSNFLERICEKAKTYANKRDKDIV